MTMIRTWTAAVGALACVFAVGAGHAQGVTKTTIPDRPILSVFRQQQGTRR